MKGLCADMTKRQKRKIGKVIYWTFLTIYGCLLIAIALILLGDWGKYLQAYESSRSDTVVERYMDNLNSSEWSTTVLESVNNMPHPFQTNEECTEIVNKMLGEKLQYSQAPSTDPDVVIYNVYCNGNPVGHFQLQQDKSQLPYIDIGLISKVIDPVSVCPWAVTGDSFDISGFRFTSSVSVTIPENYTVRLNGRQVGREYITQTNIKYDVLEPYYEEFPGLPTKVTYTVNDQIFGTLEPVVYDEKGNVVTIDSEGDDSQFMSECSAAEKEEMTQFANEFIEPYARFTGTKNLMGNMAELKRFVKPGSDLDNRIQLFVDGGADYMNFYAVEIADKKIDSIYALGGGFYVINATYTTTNYAEYKTVNETVSKRIIVCRDESGVLAVSCQ